MKAEFKRFRLHKDSGDAGNGFIKAYLILLQSTLTKFDRNNIFNTDECGLMYLIALGKTIALH